ncbi:MAG: CRISPR-associated RAMP Cmr5 [uncultured Sulfurovum sp.]|uniref:CRISPR type III-B/RAMP module-associated protein Cmr5 n=1 Tax=uncultured Sulfurovum sp. TaxID=269237 RepID=A0A6S6SS50_9BACT|nr:MAG: CRISPR-associated RAMP Cmr5 [uncultured Sulfurovum sp.]
MSKQKIENYIPKAMKVISYLEIEKEGKVAKQFNGYIASFGASIRQAGLLPTILFYGNANSNAEKEREKVVKAIEEIIGYSIQDNVSKESTRLDVESAAIALKLSIRTFELVKD